METAGLVCEVNETHAAGEGANNAYERSYELCTCAERLLWARLAVFADGVELEAAEGVCAGDNLAAEDLLDLVSSLVDKSILIRERYATVVRYRLLGTIREFGRDKLRQAGEETAVRRRHRDWYAELVARAEAEWISSRQADWFARLEREHPNLRAALEFCLVERPAVIGWPLDQLRHVRGPVDESAAGHIPVLSPGDVVQPVG